MIQMTPKRTSETPPCRSAIPAPVPVGSTGAGTSVEPFPGFLDRAGLELTRSEAVTLQVNVGLQCNQECRHCHLEAGPGRSEAMDLETARQVIDFAKRSRFKIIDITGGAPELNPHLPFMIEHLAPLASEMILRSNLTLLAGGKYDKLLDLCGNSSVAIVGSLPSLSKPQTDSQRGEGVFALIIEALRKLNSKGYGQPGSGLVLNLVSNPAGAFAPAPQEQMEKKFRIDLERKWGIVFTRLYTFGNVPLGRFRQWLARTGNFHGYMNKLASGFNPATLSDLMCRTLLSVSWDGRLYDCDFNQAAGLPLGGGEVHISSLEAPPGPGSPIAVGDHCYACTAGPGFT